MASPATDAAKSAFPPFDPTFAVSTIFWLVVAFAGLYYLMSRIALPRLGTVMEERAQRIENDLADASAMQKKAEEAGQALEATQAASRANAQKIAQTARDEATAAFEARRKTIEADLSAKLHASEESLTAAKAAAMANVQAIAADTAGAIVERITGKKPSDAAVKAAVAAGVN